MFDEEKQGSDWKCSRMNTRPLRVLSILSTIPNFYVKAENLSEHEVTLNTQKQTSCYGLDHKLLLNSDRNQRANSKHKACTLHAVHNLFPKEFQSK